MNTNLTYRYGTHFKIGYGRCYCIQKLNIFGNYFTIFETDDKDEWNVKCDYYSNS